VPSGHQKLLRVAARQVGLGPVFYLPPASPEPAGTRFNQSAQDFDGNDDVCRMAQQTSLQCPQRRHVEQHNAGDNNQISVHMGGAAINTPDAPA
jgi:hypothetical protein